MASTKDIGLGTPIWGCPFTLRFPLGSTASLLQTGLAGAADSEVSLDGGNFADCTNEIAEIGTTGWYWITLEAAEMQASSVALKVLSGDYGYHATLYPVRCATLATGTAAAGGAATLTLAAGSVIADGEYDGCVLQLTGGTGQGQAARIISSVASTRVLTVQAEWLTTPDDTTTYAVLQPPERARRSVMQDGLATLDNQTTILNRLGAWTGSAANTVLGAIRALASKTATLPSDIGGTFDPATDSIEAISESIAASGTGTGAHTITLYVHDDAGTPVAGAVVTVPTAGVQVSAPPDGATTWNLDAATYQVLIRTSPYYTPDAAYPVVVAGDGTTTPADGILVVTATGLPAPSGADNLILYGYHLAVEAGAPLTTTVRVVDIQWRGQIDTDDAALYALRHTEYTTDAYGLWYIEVPRALFAAQARIDIRFSWTDAQSQSKSEIWRGNLEPVEVTVDQWPWTDATNLTRVV